ncbi:Uncharacterised protein [Chlamydia trachomatis]|nr:Uncharacterised protein [Chlamydia trachomatis]
MLEILYKVGLRCKIGHRKAQHQQSNGEGVFLEHAHVFECLCP